MTLETFFEKFDIFADAPDAVAKVRELVLELAMQGKLSERRISDQDDASWRAFISALDQIHDSHDPVPTSPFEIPTEWRWVNLGKVAAPCGNKNPDGPFTYIDVGSIDNQKGRIKDAVEILNEFNAPSRARKLVKLGTVIFSTVRPYLRNIAVVDRTFKPSAIASTAFAILHPVEFLNSQFLFYWLRSSSFEMEVSKRMKGVAYPAISDGNFWSCSMPLPPLTEQKRIVTKVDELMKLCDRLERRQQERETRHAALARASLARFADAPNPANLSLLFHKSYNILPADLRKSILTVAFAGKLVPQDPNDEPASVLLEKARAEKARLVKTGLVKKEPWAHKLEDASTLYELPSGWQWTNVSNVVEKVTVGFVGSMKEEYRPTGVPFLRSQNVRANRYEPVGLTYISDEFHRSINKSALHPGDVVVTRSGNVGVTCVIPESLPEANCSDLVIVKRPIALVPAFLSYFINSIAGGQIEAKTVGIALTHFNTQSVAQMTVALPPLAEQRRIVAKVDELMAMVEKLEAQINNARAVASELLEAAVADLTGIERHSKSAFNNYMKSNAAKSWKPRPRVEPLKLSTQSFVLRRFKMESPYRSLSAFDCLYHLEKAGPKEASPICLVGLNGSGKSNLIEAIAEVFCFLELINLPWKRVESTSSRYRKNRHVFELEYTLADSRGERSIRVNKKKKSGAEFFIVKSDGTEEEVTNERDRLLLLPRRIIGYSSGLNETVSHPFLRTRTIYSEEVRDAAPPEGISPPEDNRVFDTRTLYMDYESNAAILICNFIFRKRSELALLNNFTRVRNVSSFGLHFNRKRAGKSGLHSTVRLTGELHSNLKKFAYCAGAPYDETQLSYNFSFKLTPEVRKRFRQEFKTAENLFMAMHKWSLLNALVLSDEQRKVYLRSDITKGALERPPSVPPSDRIFDIVDLKLNLSVPKIEIDYSGLSDGEHQFIQVFGTAMLFSEPGTLFLLDEPESHFNPEWRTKFNLILNALANASRQEYIISTHSPFIVSGSRQSNVYKFERHRAAIQFAPVNFETYGASFDVLLKKLFSIDSLIDESAKEELQKIIKRGKVQEMKAAVGEFAESKEKRKLYEAIITKEKK